jgi:uncharacterized repeat protein (TIGR01451 family)
MVVSFALLPCAGAAAQVTQTSDFDTFTSEPGNRTGVSIDGQQGWRSGTVGGQPFDQGIVGVEEFYSGGVPGFGAKAWRFSNLRFDGGFVNQTFSPQISPPVTENGPNTEYIAQLAFMTATPDPQPGLLVSFGPDNGAGGRMSWVQLIDADEGTLVRVWDTRPNGSFTAHDVAALRRGTPHTIRFWIKLHPGPNNDVVGIYIDGDHVGKQFTTWENYYRGLDPPQAPPDISHLLFRAAENTGFDEFEAGYLFFGPTRQSGDGPGPPEPDVEIDKTASVRTVRSGGLVRYTITVRNRGRAVARNILVCDRIPRRVTFVRADRRLRRIGRRRCLAINSLAAGRRRTFHLTARVNRNAPAGRIINRTDEAEMPLGPTAPGPPARDPDIPGRITRPRPEPGGTAGVRVVRPAAPPPVTG